MFVKVRKKVFEIISPAIGSPTKRPLADIFARTSPYNNTLKQLNG